MPEAKLYIVTDRNDKDREDPMLDFFETQEAAEDFAREWLREVARYDGTLEQGIADGLLQIETWPSIDHFRRDGS
jgi:hypothetical protein